jgi:hypothetical protein
MIGAMLAGWDDVFGIEADARYVEIARKRIYFWRRWGGGLDELRGGGRGGNGGVTNISGSGSTMACRTCLPN